MTPFRWPALAGAVMLWCATPALAQMPGAGGPPPVGVAQVAARPITETQEFVGRIQAPARVALVARVTAFLDKQAFTEGAEVKQGDLLYLLERGPFEADLAAKQAAQAQAQAQLDNAKLAYERAAALLRTPAGQQAQADAARATMLSDAAQLRAAEAQVRQAAINLAYTEIRAPISGRIGRTAVTPGNVVSPGSGTLATIVSQDPMQVLFAVPTRTVTQMMHGVADPASAYRIRLRLPDGRLYEQPGRLDMVDNTVSQGTDTVTVRGVVPNPPAGGTAGAFPARPLIDGAFLTVILEGARPEELPAIPEVAVMRDQQGPYVYALDAQNQAQIARVTLGPASGGYVAVTKGLSVGQSIVVDGIQKVRPGQKVTPQPMQTAQAG